MIEICGLPKNLMMKFLIIEDKIMKLKIKSKHRLPKTIDISGFESWNKIKVFEEKCKRKKFIKDLLGVLSLMVIIFFVIIGVISFAEFLKKELVPKINQEQGQQEGYNGQVGEDEGLRGDPEKPFLEERTDLGENKAKFEIMDFKETEMISEIKLAAEEFDVPEGLILGIAQAESSMGKNFYNAYDKENCHNWWGLKGGNERLREDSYLRCFKDNKAGARTMAKLLREYYLDEGKDTPEKIVRKYVGRYDENWVKIVNSFFDK